MIIMLHFKMDSSVISAPTLLVAVKAQGLLTKW